MPKLVVLKGSPATCGHTATGANKVFAESIEVTRVGDTAGASITGPGNPKVFVEGKIVSVAGDTVAAHDSRPTHIATTTSLCKKVFSG